MNSQLSHTDSCDTPELHLQVDEWLTYDFPTSVRNRLTGTWARYLGQTQKWVLMYFYGEDEEINLDSHSEREFSEYQWMPLDEIASKKVPNLLLHESWCSSLSFFTGAIDTEKEADVSTIYILQVVPFKAAVYARVASEFCPLIRHRQTSGRLDDPWWKCK